MVVTRIRASTRFISRVRKTKKSEKKSVFFKNEGQIQECCQKYFYRRSALRMRVFRLYIAKFSPFTFDGQMEKTRISATFGRYGAFPDLWRHTYREFLSVIIDLAYRPNETFCSRTHRFGWARKLWLAGKVDKFTEMAIITLRILSSVGDAWRPPGHPRRLRPV